MEKNVHTCATYVRVLLNNQEFAGEVNQALTELGCRWHANYTCYGDVYYCTDRNSDYNVDTNCMIKKTLGPFFGHEKYIRDIAAKYNLKLYLEIVPHICRNSDEPTPILSLDDDIIGFLYESGISMDLDYYIE